MSTWTVYSRTEPGGRWLNWNGSDWRADPETTTALTRPGFAFPLTPTGPIQTGYGPGESQLLAAAMYLIPAPATAGQIPDYPPLPPMPGDATP